MGLMTVKDLGERWGLSESKVKELVRESRFRSWGLAGGRLAAELEPSAVPAGSYRAMGARASGHVQEPYAASVIPARSLLGDWRSKTKTASRN